ncbi:MAG TPA: antitoxin [Acidimicrobiales bacterium]
MGFMDKVKGMFGQHADKAEGGVDRGGDFVDDKTGDKYADHVDKGQDAATDALGKLDDEGRAP